MRMNMTPPPKPKGKHCWEAAEGTENPAEISLACSWGGDRMQLDGIWETRKVLEGIREAAEGTENPAEISRAGPA